MIRLLTCALLAWGSLARGDEPLEVPHTSQPPVIDGTLETEVWKQAALLPPLSPARGASEKIPQDQSTIVLLLWDEGALYVAFTCRDDRITSSPGYNRDGDLYQHDVVEVFMHAEGAPVPYVELVISPLNQILDAAHFLTAPPESNKNGILPDPFLKKHFWTFRSWTWEGLETATKKQASAEGWIWTVEARLPVGKLLRQQMRDAFQAGDVLRANFLRYDWIKNSKGDPVLRQVNWKPVLTGCPHISPESMGRLQLMGAPKKAGEKDHRDFPDIGSLLLRYEADHPSNQVNRHEAFFTPSDVDSDADVLRISGMSFPFRRPSLRARGVNPNLVPVYLEETTGEGSLPTPLQPDTPYYAVDDEEGLALYPLGTDAHADITLIGDGRHRVLEADPAVQDVGRIRLEDRGSGRFRIFTGPTISRLADLVHDTYHLTATGRGGVGREFELVTEDGVDLLVHRGAITSLANMNDHSYHGKFMAPAGDQRALKQRFAGNNTLYQIFVGEVPVYRRRYKSKTHLFDADHEGAINLSTNTLALDGTRGLAAKEPVRVYAGERGEVPAGLEEDTPYVARILDRDRVALFRSAEQAEEDKDRLSLRSAGKGIWSLVLTQRVADSPKNEYIGLDVSRPDYSNTHDLVLQLKNTAASGFHGKVRPRMVQTGTRGSIRKEYAGGLALIAWAPRDTILPEYQASASLWRPGDPEPALKEDRIQHESVYFSSRSSNPSSPYLRLHLTEAQATLCAGLPGDDPRVIHNALQFTTKGEGEWTLYPDEAANESTFNLSGHGRMAEADPVIPADELSVFVIALDRNGTGENTRVYYYARDPGSADLKDYHRFESEIPKSPFGPATDDSDVVLLGNSAQAHVPGRFKLHAVLLGTDGPDGRLPIEDIHRIVTYYKTKLGIGFSE